MLFSVLCRGIKKYNTFRLDLAFSGRKNITVNWTKDTERKETAAGKGVRKISREWPWDSWKVKTGGRHGTRSC